MTKLALTLEDFDIGLSGAIPDRKDWSEPAMDRAIVEFVASFTGLVLKYGGRIVHSCHPSFTPIILRQARQQASRRIRKPLTLVMSELWAQDLGVDDVAAMTDVAEFIITRKAGSKGPDDAETRNASLTAMRRVLIDSQNLMVAVGGKMHSTDGLIPGVAEEMKLAAKKGIPRFLVGGLGGFSRKLATELTPNSLGNYLSREDNETLFGTRDISACVSVLFAHLTRSKELARACAQPIKWNPGLKAILDHRDGTLDVDATRSILKAVA